MKKLHIIGAGGLAKEIISYIIGEENKRYQIIGCWSENQFNNDKYAQFYSGNFDKFKKEYNCEEYVLMAVANSKIRRKIIEETLVNLDINYENYIHPSCNVSTFSVIGKGCILAPQTIICADAVLKDYNFLNTECVVGHDTTLADYCTLFPKVEIFTEKLRQDIETLLKKNPHTTLLHRIGFALYSQYFLDIKDKKRKWCV